MRKHFALLAFAAFALAASPALAQSTERVVYHFGRTSTDSRSPQDGVIADKAGNLYGTAAAGGDHGDGTVFKVGADGTYTILYSFAGGAADGATPDAGLAMDENGNLFGTTNVGGSGNSEGTVFEVSPACPADPSCKTYTEKVLYNFCSKQSCIDGAQPKAGVVIGKKGVLYGTTQAGGFSVFYSNLAGVVWRLDPPGRHETAWNETVLYKFCQIKSQINFCADGYHPATRLLLAKDGALYGTTPTSDGTSSTVGGTLYRVTTDGTSFQVLHDFGKADGDGDGPVAALNADKDGVLYGTTGNGGLKTCGTAYSYLFDPVNPVYKTIYSFCTHSNDGSRPSAGLTVFQDKGAPTLYGTTTQSVEFGHGTFFKLTPPQNGDPWTVTTLYSFCLQSGCGDGATPSPGAPLLFDKVFYGTTILGGGSGDPGVLYRLSKP
jgi:uncharacterized repeat protein (TIGR03803 family)